MATQPDGFTGGKHEFMAGAAFVRSVLEQLVGIFGAINLEILTEISDGTVSAWSLTDGIKRQSAIPVRASAA